MIHGIEMPIKTVLCIKVKHFISTSVEKAATTFKCQTIRGVTTNGERLENRTRKSFLETTFAHSKSFIYSIQILEMK